ncbi:hypothetical protein H4S02_004995, partial [Coemansia sp. RSA 2611]
MASSVDFSHIALAANCKEKFESTVDFYLSLGLSIVRKVTHDRAQRDIGHENNIISEAWLHLFASRPENSVTVRIIHVDGDEFHCQSTSDAIRICLATPEIKNIKEILAANNHTFTVHADPNFPVDRIATRDPLGNEVFFTPHVNTFSIPSSPEIKPVRVEQEPAS